MKVLIAVTHLLGVGHLARAAALGRGLAAAGHSVTLVSGGRAAPVVETAGMEFVQLSPVHVRDGDFRTLFDGSGAPAPSGLIDERARRLREIADDVRPDVAILELFPFGRRQLAGEFLTLLRALRGQRPAPVILSSVRDVLAPPSSNEKRLFADEMLATYFDGVLVHGDPAILPLEASWPVSPGLRKVLRYTGYVAETGTGHSATRQRQGILVSGGGSESSLPILEAAASAARLSAAHTWRLLAGHGLPEDDFQRVRQHLPANATLERARPDFQQLLAGAACSVSQAGYNTMLDIVVAGVPAVIVPYERGGEREQAIRAACFATLGLARVVPESQLSPQSLAGAVESALSSGNTENPPIDIAGASRAVAVIGQAVADRRQLRDAWARLDAVLDRCAGAGREVRVWWRDDDAVEPTPALERLLELSARLNLPLSLAVIPDKATAGLAARLAGEPRIDVLVHGIAHRNNAGPADKKQELVRADEATLEALSRGRMHLQALFGPRSLPVLVPPWNRMAAGLESRLPEAGFAGVSTFAKRIFHGPSNRVDTHVDPIDWRGGGGLVRAPAHIATLAAMVEEALSEDPPVLGPVGLLTHHLVHDPWVWAHVEECLERLASHRAVRFCAARELFGLT